VESATIVWTNEAEQIAEGIGKLADALAGIDCQWATIQLGAGLPEMVDRVLERGNPPIGNLPGAACGDFGVGEMKTQFRRADRNCRERFVDG